MWLSDAVVVAAASAVACCGEKNRIKETRKCLVAARVKDGLKPVPASYWGFCGPVLVANKMYVCTNKEQRELDRLR